MERSNNLRAQFVHTVHTTRNSSNVWNKNTGYFIKPASSIPVMLILYIDQQKNNANTIAQYFQNINRARNNKVENKAYNF